MVAIPGSIEILRSGQSSGAVGVAWVPEEVPIVLRNLYGIHDMTAETPSQRPTGRTPAHQWGGKDGNNQSVTILLWEALPFDEAK